MTTTDVLIVGAGPSGLTTANILARYGLNFRIIDSRAGLAAQSRAAIVHTRTLELWDKLGLAHSAIERGIQLTAVRVLERGRYITHLPLSSEEAYHQTPFPYALSLEQSETEALLAASLADYGIPIEWNKTFLRLEQSADGVMAHIQSVDGSEETIAAKWLVGADGASSAVRHALNTPFEGSTYEQALFLADVEMDTAGKMTEFSLNLTHGGFVGILPLNHTGLYRLFGALTPKYARLLNADEGHPIQMTDLQTWFDEYFYVNVQLTKLHWASIYRSHRRMAAHFRVGRCFLIGDAAHIHSPAGGQGMNLGIGDAFNLAWKLALVVEKQAQAEILDTYEVERKPTAVTIMQGSDRGFEMEASTNPFVEWFRLHLLPRLLKVLTRLPPVKGMIFQMFSQLWIHYRTSPLAGSGSASKGRVQPGDRAPYSVIQDHGQQTTTYEQLRGLEHHIYLFEGSTAKNTFAALADKLAEVLDCYEVPFQFHRVPSANHSLHHAYGVGETALFFLIRPDGHIGYVGEPARIAEFTTYLDRFYMRKVPS